MAKIIRIPIKHKPKPFIEDKWNKWTNKSIDIPFKYTQKGLGDGEEKLCKEYNTKPCGQNSSYDCKIKGIKCECKKLDNDKSFRVGVSALSAYTNIQSNLINILNIIRDIHSKVSHPSIDKIYNSCFKINKKTTSKTTSKTTIIQGLFKSELCESNLVILDNIIKELKTFVFKIEPKRITIPNPHYLADKSVEVDFYHYLKLIYKENIVKEIMGTEEYALAIIKYNLQEYLQHYKDITVKEELNIILRDTFADKTLIFVDKELGFYPTKNYNKL